MRGAHRTLLTALVLVAACAGPRATGAQAPVSAVRLELRAEPVHTALGLLEVGRFRVTAPAGHGYEPGRQVALFGRVAGLPDAQPVGAAEVVEVFPRSFELLALWLEPAHEGERLEVGELPAGHHFGFKLGQVLTDVRDPRRVRINMGEAHGVTVGTLYTVLGDASTDANAGGRSLGREPVGLVQVIEAPKGGQTALAELRQGAAPAGAWVRHAGHEPVQRQPQIRLLVTGFRGDRGSAYREALLQALERTLKVTEHPDIRLETTERVVDIVDANEEQVTRLGREFKVDVVVWGSADSLGRDMVVRPRLTFIDAREHGERLWDPVKMDADRVARAEPDALSRRVQGLASYLAGRMYYTDFEHKVAGSYALAAAHFKAAITHGEAVDADAARGWLFYCLERTGDWAGAEQAARAIEREGRTRKDDRRRSLGLFMLARLGASTGALDQALEQAREAARLDGQLGDIRSRAVTMGKIADILSARGELDEALRIREQEVLPVVDKLGDIRGRAVTMGKVADILETRGELDEALRIRKEEQLPVYDKLGDIHSRAVTMGNIADTLSARGELDEALRIHRQEVLPVYDKLGDIRGRAVTMSSIADIVETRGELDEALRIRKQELLPVVDKLGDIRGRAVTMGHIADILEARGELDEALRIRKEEELPVYDKLGDIRSRAVTMGNIADILSARGELDEALRIREQEVLPVFDKLGDIRGRAVTMGNIADILETRGELDEALRIHKQEVLPVVDKLGDIRSRAVTMGQIADILSARGALDEALRIRKQEQLPVYDKLGDIHGRAVTMGKIADILYARGELDEALRIHRQEVLPVVDKLGDIRSRAVTMGKIADILSARGELDEALRIYKQEVLPAEEKLGEKRGFIVNQANIALILLARKKPGDRKEAAALLQQALATARAMGLPEAGAIAGILKRENLIP